MMVYHKSLVIALLSLAPVDAASTMRKRFKPGRSLESQSIYGGTAVPSGEFPYFGLISYEDTDYVCGGVLIGPKHVLTLAYCLDEKMDGIYLGATDSQTDGTLYEVAIQIPHPGYDGNEGEDFYSNNLGIVILAEEVKDITPAVMPKVPSTVGTSLTIMGFGYFDDAHDTTGGSHNASEYSQYLRKTTTKHVAQSVCGDGFEAYIGGPLEEEHMCLYNSGPTGACSLDYGGPAVDSNDVVWGIMLDYIKPCESDTPDLYVDVYVHRKWIEAAVAVGGEPTDPPQGICGLSWQFMVRTFNTMSSYFV